MRKKMSIIIPAYNTEGYMAECLESLLNQSLEEIEIIVVDDGSTDNTLDVLKKYESAYPEKLKVFHKENGGQASARNFALQYAEGEYLGFVDSDDWVDLTMYKEMYAKAKEENADIVICDMIDHYPDKDVYHHASCFDDKFKVTPSACNKIFRADFAKGMSFPVGLWYEDFEFTTKLLMKTEKIAVIHEGFYHCHCRKVSTMNNNNAEKNKDMITVLNHLEQYVKDNGWWEKYSKVIEHFYLEHVLITTINRLERQTNSEKGRVIRSLRNEVLKRYPYYYKGTVYKGYPRNRRIIARLNGMGLSKISKLVLDIKSKL